MAIAAVMEPGIGTLDLQVVLTVTPSPDPREDPKSRSPNNGPKHSYGVDYRTLRWINIYYLLDIYISVYI